MLSAVVVRRQGCDSGKMEGAINAGKAVEVSPYESGLRTPWLWLLLTKARRILQAMTKNASNKTFQCNIPQCSIFYRSRGNLCTLYKADQALFRLTLSFTQVISVAKHML